MIASGSLTCGVSKSGPCSTPTRLMTASCPRTRRSSTPGATMSVSTTSTVGSTMRCFARSRRRDGTVTLMPRRTRPATTWRPMKPEPPNTSTLSSFIRVSFRQVVFDRLGVTARRDRAKARLEGGRLLLRERRVKDGVGHHFLHVVARLRERNRFGVNRALERAALIAPAPGARGARVVGRGGKDLAAELVEHDAQIAGAERDVGLRFRDRAAVVAANADLVRDEAGGARHHLHQARGARARARVGDEAAFLAHES